ncbi:hypothetical protein BGW38_008055 [Lunasporangiospora selenospora]|uniref:Uncharacterized protein n=1 Tax=Lunasporangiospora selenospora TaxID=979761 RepID=A0A9P6FL24_9FUNG|nr:hypothetical protein BGW38_008055 [Lunasporangiospora selenospora]
MMGRKLQMQRRAEQLSSTNESITAVEKSMYHNPLPQVHAASTGTASRSESGHASTGTCVAFHRANMDRHLVSAQRRHRRHPYAAGLDNGTRDDDALSMQLFHAVTGGGNLMSISSAGHSSLARHSSSSWIGGASIMLLPQPSVATLSQRMDIETMSCSLVPTPSAFCLDDSTPQLRRLNKQRGNDRSSPSGARTHSGNGAGSDGGGSGAPGTSPEGSNPGGGEGAEGETPSEYTFRRRNAIVEGVDDAPKADDFPSSPPK